MKKALYRVPPPPLQLKSDKEYQSDLFKAEIIFIGKKINEILLTHFQ